MKAIFFTKDRPMQFRALLESFYFNFHKDIDVSVVMEYRPEYDDIIQEFNAINYIIENDFNTFGDALTESIIRARKDLILFGVDDQIITDTVDFESTYEAMVNQDVLCHSFRLGLNTKGFETLDAKEVTDSLSSHYEYFWKGKTGDWGYPFSLDFHVYRGSDLVQLLDSGYRVPADFEARSYPIMMQSSRDKMSISSKNSVAYCQDLNKVQLLHGAPHYGDPILHSTDYLLSEYTKGVRLDWKSAQGYIGDKPFCREAIWKLK